MTEDCQSEKSVKAVGSDNRLHTTKAEPNAPTNSARIVTIRKPANPLCLKLLFETVPIVSTAKCQPKSKVNNQKYSTDSTPFSRESKIRKNTNKPKMSVYFILFLIPCFLLRVSVPGDVVDRACVFFGFSLITIIIITPRQRGQGFALLLFSILASCWFSCVVGDVFNNLYTRPPKKRTEESQPSIKVQLAPEK